jgi:hypothetical protein
MLSAGMEIEGSAGYVAKERLNGTLHGRRGPLSFNTRHMNRGGSELRTSVVPNSATDELSGLAGKMTISGNRKGTKMIDKFSFGSIRIDGVYLTTK